VDLKKLEKFTAGKVFALSKNFRKLLCKTSNWRDAMYAVKKESLLRAILVAHEVDE
jgi:hypothetical protein